jgi:integrase
MRAVVREVPPPAIGGTFVRPSGYRRPRVDEGAVVRVDLDELVEHWTLLDDERELIAGKRGPTLHIDAQRRAGAVFLFESSWKKPYSGRGVRKILARYTQAAGITASISPHTLRHFLFTWLKTQGIDDALIQPYSGHATRQSLEIYSRLALADAQQRYDDVIGDFPV